MNKSQYDRRARKVGLREAARRERRRQINTHPGSHRPKKVEPKKVKFVLVNEKPKERPGFFRRLFGRKTA